MRWNEFGREACSMARTASVIGDRWTLLMLRDCFPRVRRSEDFQERLGITRPILADRLKKLVDEFVLVKVPYQQRPVRHEYRLTQKGLDLYPIVIAIVHWGESIWPEGRAGRCCTGTIHAARISTRSWSAPSAARRSRQSRSMFIPGLAPKARAICRRRAIQDAGVARQ
jgi:DNA-binding HxlR family transcriptional regulator